MGKQDIYIKPDGFRFINNVHTTARQLFVCSQIIHELGNKHMPRQLLRDMLTKWSRGQEQTNPLYRDSKGKLTHNGKETSTLRYYLDLCHSLGLINNLNNIFSNTKLSTLYLYFFPKRSPQIGNLSLNEKTLYLFLLMTVDADGILLAIEVLLASTIKSQIELQKKCKEVLNERLLSKQELASPLVKSVISEKYRTVNYLWKKPEKYAEHVLSPRLEWLSSLGIVQIIRQQGSTVYDLTADGRKFYEALPSVSITLKDINEPWMQDNFFVLADVLYPQNNRTPYKKLDSQRKKDLIELAMGNATNVVKSSNSFRFPLFDTLFFICLEFFLVQNIIPSFSELLLEIQNGLVIGKKQYLVNISARINESYISTRVIA